MQLCAWMQATRHITTWRNEIWLKSHVNVHGMDMRYVTQASGIRWCPTLETSHEYLLPQSTSFSYQWAGRSTSKHFSNYIVTAMSNSRRQQVHFVGKKTLSDATLDVHIIWGVSINLLCCKNGHGCIQTLRIQNTYGIFARSHTHTRQTFWI